MRSPRSDEMTELATLICDDRVVVIWTVILEIDVSLLKYILFLKKLVYIFINMYIHINGKETHPLQYWLYIQPTSNQDWFFGFFISFIVIKINTRVHSFFAPGGQSRRSKQKATNNNNIPLFITSHHISSEYCITYIVHHNSPATFGF